MRAALVSYRPLPAEDAWWQCEEARCSQRAFAAEDLPDFVYFMRGTPGDCGHAGCYAGLHAARAPADVYCAVQR